MPGEAVWIIGVLLLLVVGAVIPDKSPAERDGPAVRR